MRGFECYTQLCSCPISVTCLLQGCSPLHYIAALGDDLDMLLSHGADINAVDVHVSFWTVAECSQ